MIFKRLPPGAQAPFTHHLEELRQRILFCVVFLVVVFGALYAVSDRLIAPFAALLNTKLVFLSPLEAFMAYMSISFYAALGVSVPVIAYHVWAFISPGLLPHENRYAAWAVVASGFFFLAGLAFCWFVVLPFAIPFLMAYGGDVMTPMISVKAYLNFCLSMLLVFGLVFELPVVMALINAIGLASYDALRNFRRYWVVVAFIIGAIVTPTPDLVNQALASVPLVVLYELSLVYIRFFGKNGKTEEDGLEKTGA